LISPWKFTKSNMAALELTGISLVSGWLNCKNFYNDILGIHFELQNHEKDCFKNCVCYRQVQPNDGQIFWPSRWNVWQSEAEIFELSGTTPSWILVLPTLTPSKHAWKTLAPFPSMKQLNSSASSVAILGNISPIGLHLSVICYTNCSFATFYFRYILGDFDMILSKLYCLWQNRINNPSNFCIRVSNFCLKFSHKCAMKST